VNKIQVLIHMLQSYYSLSFV